MLRALDVPGVMPPEPGLSLDQCHHRGNPLRMVQAVQSTLERCSYIAEPVAALHCIAAEARSAFNFSELGPGLTVPGRQVVSWSGHLRRLRQSAGYFSCFFLQHNSSYKILYIKLVSLSTKLLEAWTLQGGPTSTAGRAHAFRIRRPWLS